MKFYKAFLILILVAAIASAQTPAGADLGVYHIRGPIYMIVGAGGNITASIGPDGVLIVDTGLAQNADKVLATIKDIQKQLTTNGTPTWSYAAETRSNMVPMMGTIPAA